MEILSNSPKQTQKAAKDLAQEIARNLPLKKAFVIGLKGDLGGGKTTFVQGLAKALGIKEKITSPTFVLLKRFKINKNNFENFYHIDCYRAEGPEDLKELGLKKIISSPKNIVAIEWAERIKTMLPKRFLMIEFQFIDKKKRKITILWKKKEL